MNEDTNSNTTSTEPSDIKSQVLAFRDNAHAANVKKLKAGIKCIFTVPACFLILLFLTGKLQDHISCSVDRQPVHNRGISDTCGILGLQGTGDG